MPSIRSIGVVAALAVVAGLAHFTQAAPLWTPGEIFTEMWLDAADQSTITLNGSTVSQWDDKSGFNRHVKNTNAAKQPTYNPNGFNGGTMPSLEFRSPNPGAAHDGQQLEWNGSLPPWDWTIFFVYDDQNNDNDTFMWAAPAGGFNEHRFITNANGTRFVSDSNNGGTGTAARVLGEQLISGSMTGNTSELRRNGVVVAGNRGAQTYAQREIVTRISIGARGNTGHAGLNGDIAEYILLSYTPDDTTRQLIEGYLAHKWGLAGDLAGDHPYKNAAPLIPEPATLALLAVGGLMIARRRA